jgi:hypothetical protein
LLTREQKGTVLAVLQPASADEPSDSDSRALEGPSQRRAARVEMVDLLGAYSSVLDLVAGHAVFDPREGRRFARMKPAIGVESYVIRHVRANADRFIRRYRLRQALCQDDEYDERDREALDNFSASLGPVNSRFWLLLPYLISLAVVQILISAGGKPGPIWRCTISSAC